MFNIMKECFTCINKLSTYLTDKEKEELKAININNGRKYARIPEMKFECKLTGKSISQIDPACENYSEDDDMSDIKSLLVKTVKNIRKELE